MSVTSEALAGFEKFEKPVVSRTTLRRGQAALYDLLSDKIKSGGTVTLPEAREIWLHKVCRNMIDGVPHRTSYFPAEDGTNNWYPKNIPMSEDEVLFSVLNWLTKNIGVLVMRGYLKVIPMVELV